MTGGHGLGLRLALTSGGTDSYIDDPFRFGEVSEWSKEAVLKTVEPQGSVGSNPTLSAKGNGSSTGEVREWPNRAPC